MKKLLLSLSLFSTITPSLFVASCGSVKRFTTDEVDISSELAEKIIMKLKNDDSIMPFVDGELFYKIDFKDILLKMIDQIISKKTFNNYNNELETKFKINFSKSENSDKSQDVLKNLSLIKLFSDYTSKLAKEIIRDNIDIEYKKEVGFLNPVNLKGKNDDARYAVYYKENNKWMRWQHIGEFGTNEFSSISMSQIPKIKTLTNLEEKLFRVADIGNDKSKDEKTKIISENDSNVNWYKENNSLLELNGLEVMQYRFARYFKVKIQSTMFESLLGNSYLNSNLFSTQTDTNSAVNKKLVLNSLNAFITDIQSGVHSIKTSESKIKMLWSISLENEKFNDIKNELSKIINEDGSLINNDEKSLIKILNKYNEFNKNDHGIDPIFASKGFNGFVKNSSDSITGLTGSEVTISDDAKKDVFKSNSVKILTNNGNGYKTTDERTPNNKEIVFVLPLYLNDLFATVDTNLNCDNYSEEKENTFTLNAVKNNWIDINSLITNNIYNKDKTHDLTLGIELFEDVKEITTNSSNLVIVKKNNKHYFKITNNSDDNVLTIKYNNSNKKNAKVKINEIKANDSKTLNINEKLNINAIENKELFSNKLKENDTISYDINIRKSASQQDKQKEWQEWNEGINSKSSWDIKNLSKSKKQILLDQLEYLIGDNDTIKTQAKKTLYSKYISKDKILFENLYNEISKYLKEKDTPEFD